MPRIARIVLSIIVVFSLSLIVGCSMFGPSDEDTAQAGALMDQMADYNQWETVPGYDDWEQGTSVHGRVVRYFVNDIAIGNMRDLPAGSIIVKEGYNRDRELQAVTVMQRIAGYDPEHGDWFWARYSPSGELTHAGSVAMCIDCHQDAEGDDYSFANAGF
ncbi:cytochrome P460 family protein [Phycisphaeraceae bacterium D3-23]